MLAVYIIASAETEIAAYTRQPLGYLWIIDQEDGCPDPGLRDSDWNENLVNQNSLDRIPSRAAIAVLWNLMQIFSTLEWVPGAVDYGYKVNLGATSLGRIYV